MTASSRLFAATATAASLLALAACNKGGGTPPAAPHSVNSATTTVTAGGFVTQAATSDLYEIQAAKIAEQKATSPAVKKFAARMARDHTASTGKLKAILAGGTVSATTPTKLDERRKGLINNLNSAAPADFDKTYVDQQIAAHQEAVILLQGYAQKGDNAVLRAFATGVLPTVRAHLAIAKSVKDAIT
jgi:putative membrane protein